MANYREHVTVSSMLGLGYGLGAVVSFGFTPVQGMLAACLTGVAGMLPDLDSASGRPVREMFGLVGAVAPLLIVHRVLQWLDLPGDSETVILMVVVLYLLIKYGGALLVRTVSVHRGMFHSIPAMVIAAELVFLGYPSQVNRVRLMMAGAVAIGFLSHLLLDELYSVKVKDARVQLKRSSGTAIKLTGEGFGANVISYSLLAMLTYLTMYEAGWLDQSRLPSGQPRPMVEALEPDGSPGGSPSGLGTETGQTVELGDSTPAFDMSVQPENPFNGYANEPQPPAFEQPPSFAEEYPTGRYR
ncbi:MAG: metal-dependent hydrolase [Planctomycetaceae bacterium]